MERAYGPLLAAWGEREIVTWARKKPRRSETELIRVVRAYGKAPTIFVNSASVKALSVVVRILPWDANVSA